MEFFRACGGLNIANSTVTYPRARRRRRVRRAQNQGMYGCGGACVLWRPWRRRQSALCAFAPGGCDHQQGAPLVTPPLPPLALPDLNCGCQLTNSRTHAATTTAAARGTQGTVHGHPQAHTCATVLGRACVSGGRGLWGRGAHAAPAAAQVPALVSGKWRVWEGRKPDASRRAARHSGRTRAATTHTNPLREAARWRSLCTAGAP